MGKIKLGKHTLAFGNGTMAFVKSGTLREQQTLALIGGADPFTPTFGGQAGVRDVKNHVWVQIAVNILIRCVIRGDFVLKKDGVKVSTPYDKLFNDTGSNSPSKTLFSHTMMWYGWEGEFFWAWERGFRETDSIQVLNPRRVFHEVQEDGTVRYFFHRSNGTVKELVPGEFLHIRMPNIYNPHRGVFPLYGPGMTTLRQDSLISSGHLDALESGASPDIIIKNKLRVTEQQADQYVKMWNKAYNRARHNGSRVAVLGGAAEVQELSKDLIKYIDLLDWNRTTILAMYGIPLKVANAETERTALSGKDSNEQYRALFSQTIIPMLSYWKGEINRQFFAAQGHPEISCDFDLSNVDELKEDENRVSHRENEDIRTGKVLINELRQQRGLEPLPWGDTWWKESKLSDVQATGGTNDNGKDDQSQE